MKNLELTELEFRAITIAVNNEIETYTNEDGYIIRTEYKNNPPMSEIELQGELRSVREKIAKIEREV